MCLVHVLLARHRGRVVSGVLRAVETSYIAFRGTDAIERNDHDEQRQPEKQKNRTESANDASSGRSAGGWRRHPVKIAANAATRQPRSADTQSGMATECWSCAEASRTVIVRGWAEADSSTARAFRGQ
jgi:hypothetical protein